MTPFDSTVEIVSPDFPCGAEWLANALLEFSVPLWSLWGFDTRDEWLDRGDGTFTYAAHHRPWRQTLASLHVGRMFRFRDDVRPRFGHPWQWQVEASMRTILIVRDPRDALHSEWRRHQRNLDLDPSIQFPEFVARPFFTAPVSVNDMLWLFLVVWIEAARERAGTMLTLRFEDWKEDAVRELERVDRFLELGCSRERLIAAAGASDVGILKRLEDAIALSDPTARQLNRRGQPHEWKEVWKPEWNDVFDQRWESVFSSLRYDVPERLSATSSAAVDVEKLVPWWQEQGDADEAGMRTMLARMLERR